MEAVSRRELLRSGALAAGAIAVGPAFLRDALAAPVRAGASPYGPLLPPDANGVMLPAGFRARVVARGLSAVGRTGYTLPMFPDGQATYRTREGGWVLVTNSETLAPVGAGSSAIRFGPDGTVRDAYRILGGTQLNCAGGPTPWGTWLSCEEFDDGQVWESDPAGKLPAEPRPALGVFSHEAVAVDPVGGRLYLTEDEGEGRFYRFTPDRYPSLASGRLEVAVLASSGAVAWRGVPDPTTAATGTPTREQVPGSTRFRGGEGIWYSEGVCYFTTKGDRKVWAYDLANERIEVLFDRARAQDSSLDAVDNVTVSRAGEVLVCEDGGNMELGIIDVDAGTVAPLVRLVGTPQQGKSEICGVVFDPSGERLYFTSQRAYGPLPSVPGFGAVYEMTGPFRPAPSRGSRAPAYGPPAGELRPNGPLNPGADGSAPALRLTTTRSVSRGGLTARGLAVRVSVDEPATVSLSLTTADLLRPRPGRGGSSPRPRTIRIARGTVRAEGSTTVRLRVRPPRSARARLARRRRALTARLTASARDGAGNVRTATQTIRIGPRRRRRP